MATPSNGITPAVTRKFKRHIPGTGSMMTRSTTTNLLRVPLRKGWGEGSRNNVLRFTVRIAPAQPAREAQKPHLPLPRPGDAIVQQVRDPPHGAPDWPCAHLRRNAVHPEEDHQRRTPAGRRGPASSRPSQHPSSSPPTACPLAPAATPHRVGSGRVGSVGTDPAPEPNTPATPSLASDRRCAPPRRNALHPERKSDRRAAATSPATLEPPTPAW
jgi:hypothetical protein